MKNAQKPGHVSLNTLLGRLREGRYKIPDFQRNFEWEPWDVKDLVRSLFLDYYIGSLLLWKGTDKNFKDLSCEPVEGFSGNENPEYIVLDGQQRLTALHYAFNAPDINFPQKKTKAIYYLDVQHFMNEDYDKAFSYEWATKKFQKILDDRDLQFEKHFFPISIIGKGGRTLYRWFDHYEKYWEKNLALLDQDENEEQYQIVTNFVVNAKNFADVTSELIEQYQVSYIELDKDITVDKVCDIFTQINSKGVKLDVFDLMNALTKPKGIQLKHMWKEASEKLSFAESKKMNVYVLQVMSILKQAYCSPKYLYYLIPETTKKIRGIDGKSTLEVLISNNEEFNELWEVAVVSLERSMKSLQHPQEFGVTSSNYLPYVSILPVFASLQASVRNLPHIDQADGKRKLHHWYWASVFTNRYSGSVESTAARDFQDMKVWFDNEDQQPSVIQEFSSHFRLLDLRNENNRGSSV